MTDYPLVWHRAYPVLDANAKFKQQPEDFKVTEHLPFELSGDGEHLYLLVKKTGQNTQWVARQLAIWANVKARDVSYSGLKDRQAVTKQWFSIWLPGKSDPENEFAVEGVEIIQQIRHRAKLKRGAHDRNAFEICLRNCQADTEQVDQRLETIKSRGVPNYFGRQRFGQRGDNVDFALSAYRDKKKLKRDQQSVLISAVRSWLFNQVLSLRIEQNNWQQVLTGEPLILTGSQSWFVAEGTDQEVERLKSGDCQTSAPLWGRGRPLATDLCEQFEHQAVQPWSEITDYLEHQGLKQQRRSLILMPANLNWNWQDKNLMLNFDLPAGTFATSLLREVINVDENIAV